MATLFSPSTQRRAGVLMHPTSLPGPQGIGTFGASAYAFVDFLEAASFKDWQLCPLGPTGYGDSPYQCYSAFAGNLYLIDLQYFVDTAVIDASALAPLHTLSSSSTDYAGLWKHHRKILDGIYQNYQTSPLAKKLQPALDAFVEEQAQWLLPYAQFRACKRHFGENPWYDWPEQCRHISLFNSKEMPESWHHHVRQECFYQFIFMQQWLQLKQYANDKGIQIIGDIPIFVAADSADVWSMPEAFQLNRQGKQTAQAGVPPDYFSPTGQLWGNPLYRWKQMAQDGYSWWIQRLAWNSALYDVVRIDHFRGFESYWSVPAGAPTAEKGKWVKGPGLALFKKVKQELPHIQLIAEDLGVITDKVRSLLASTGLPGMSVLQFAFGSGANSEHLPHLQQANRLLYTGTHDNDTSLGWFANLDENTRDHVRSYLAVPGDAVNWDLIRTAYRSVNNRVIVPLQDLLSLHSSARFNFPGQAMGNWQWRYQANDLKTLKSESSNYLSQLADLYGR